MKRTTLTLTLFLTLGAAALAVTPTTTAQSGSCNDGITIFGNRVACETDNCFATDTGGTGYLCSGPSWCSKTVCGRPMCVTSELNLCFFAAPPPEERCVGYTGTGVNLVCDDPDRPNRICLTSTYTVCPTRPPF